MNDCSMVSANSELDYSNVGVGKRSAETLRSWNDSDVRSMMASPESSTGSAIISVCESRGPMSEVGIAIFDSLRNSCRVVQYADSLNYSRTVQLLAMHSPIRILTCSNSIDSGRSKLNEALLDVYPLDLICFMTRSEFNDNRGREVLCRLCRPAKLESVLYSSSNKHFAHSALCALFSYLEQEIGTVFAPRSLLFETKPFDGFLALDHQTIKMLEIVSNTKDSRSEHHLFGVICRCKTPMGKRLLRQSLLQPLTNGVEIHERQEAVQELVSRDAELTSLQDQLTRFPDMDRLMSNLVRREKHVSPKIGDDLIHRALLLKRVIERGRGIGEILISFKQSPQLTSLAQALINDGLNGILALVNEVINEDIVYSHKGALQQQQRLFAVKSTTVGLLEVARRTLQEIQSDTYEYVELWSNQVSLPVSIRYQTKRGYFLSITRAALGDRPLSCIPCSQYKESRSEVTFTTMDLIKLNGHVKESMDEVLLASEEVLSGLFESILEAGLDALYELSDAVGRCDFFCGMAQWALEVGGVKPEFGDSLTIQSSRHPILEAVQGARKVVANDYFSCRGNSFTLITGPNMSGKSTYSKQLGLLVILAQAGYFLPGEYASLPIYDRILSRLGSDDDLESNASSFKMEMKENAFILDGLSESSLVIIDELGRGTGHLEGLSLALAICDDIVARSDATVLLVTHFPQLARYLQCHPKVSLIQLQAEISSVNHGLRFLYRATAGQVEIEDYGLKLAAMAGLPQDVLEEAERVSYRLRSVEGETQESSGVRRTLQRRRLIIQAAKKIEQVEDSQNLCVEAKAELVQKIKEEFQAALEDDS